MFRMFRGRRGRAHTRARMCVPACAHTRTHAHTYTRNPGWRPEHPEHSLLFRALSTARNRPGTSPEQDRAGRPSFGDRLRKPSIHATQAEVVAPPFTIDERRLITCSLTDFDPVAMAVAADAETLLRLSHPDELCCSATNIEVAIAVERIESQIVVVRSAVIHANLPAGPEGARRSRGRTRRSMRPGRCRPAALSGRST